MNYYIDVLKKYFVFDGRASRKAYWMFILFYYIFALALGILAGIIKVITDYDLSFVGYIYALIFLIPHIALLVRRAHDSNKSGWYILIPIYNIILLFLKGTEGDNEYGIDTNKTMSAPLPSSQFVEYTTPTPPTPVAPVPPEQPNNTL
jgi:uncharacterized membrane protein YhaH (DUF805 family)